MAGFFRLGGDPDPEQAEALERIEGGGIPLAAEQRLTALATDGSLFTSGIVGVSLSEKSLSSHASARTCQVCAGSFTTSSASGAQTSPG